MLCFLDPLEPSSLKRLDAVTCLIGFDFGGYDGLSPDDAESVFESRAREQLDRSASAFAKAMRTAGLENRTVELFLMPLPSVEQLRASFQSRIGNAT